MRKLIKNNTRELSVIAAILICFLVFGIADGMYLSASNVRDIIEQATIYGLMGIGMTGVIIVGGIDLSVGSVLALTGAITAKFIVAGWPPLLCAVIGLALGCLLGMINGILVTKLKLQPFIATMGTMSVYRGLAYVVTDGYPVLGISMNYRTLVNGEITPFIRVSTLAFFVFMLIMFIVLRKTKKGNSVYAIGGNEEAARLSGINIDRTKIFIYALGMLGTAMAGIIQIGKLGTGDPTTGNGYELNAIAAAAIGGTSMAGGRGNVVGTLFGAILFAALRVGLIVLGVDAFYQFIATGLVIIIAASIEVFQTSISKQRQMISSKA